MILNIITMVLHPKKKLFNFFSYKIQVHCCSFIKTSSFVIMKIPKTDNSLVLNFTIKKNPTQHQPNTGLKFELPIRGKSIKIEWTHLSLKLQPP